MPPSLSNDVELAAGLARGDEAAFAALYDRYGRAAYRLALRIVRSPELAEDAVQEAFLAAWRQAPTFDHRRAKPSTWLLMLVHRRAVDLVRRQERGRTLADRVAEQEPRVDPAGAGDASEILETRRHVLAALDALPETQRRLIELAYYGGLSQSEIAETLGLPLGTVKSRTHAALARLRELLSQDDVVRCGGVSDRRALARSAAKPRRPAPAPLSRRASCAPAR